MNKITIRQSLTPSTASTDEFFTYLLNSISNLHIKHFSSRNYAEHLALGDLYEGLEDSLDKLVEIWQGKNAQLVQFTMIHPQLEADGITQAKTIRDYILQNRAAVGIDSNIQNEVDELISLFDQQIYKLTFLE